MVFALGILAVVQAVLLVFLLVQIRRSSRMAEKTREVAARATQSFMRATQRLGLSAHGKANASTEAR